jgi:hypothetical protein
MAWTRMIKAASGISTWALCSVLACCGSSQEPAPDAPQPTAGDAAPAQGDAARTATSPEGDGAVSAPTSGPRSSEIQQIMAGSGCEGHGQDITGRSEFTRSGSAWSRQETHGCGCPRYPEFTLIYEQGSSPLRIWVCLDELGDPCERGCATNVSWDLGAVLGSATDVTFVTH